MVVVLLVEVEVADLVLLEQLIKVLQVVQVLVVLDLKVVEAVEQVLQEEMALVVVLDLPLQSQVHL